MGKPNKVEKMSRFLRLVDAKGAAFRAVNAVETTHTDAIEAIREHLDWLEINNDEDETWEARLENLACLAAAALRYAGTLMLEMPPENIEQMIRDEEGSE